MKSKGLTSRKALTMLQEGYARGHKLTHKQMRYFGAIAGGAKPKAQKRSKK